MHEFIDREIATQAMNTLLTKPDIPWIVLAGSSQIGKTEFAKKITSMNNDTILCSFEFGVSYTYAFLQSLCSVYNVALENVICEFAKQNVEGRNIFKLRGQQYVSPPKKSELKSIVNQLIKNDTSSGLYTFAYYLSENIFSNIKCIFLDDFHYCDFEAYKWIVEFWNSLVNPQPTIVVICNFELNWESAEVKNTINSIVAPVNIEKFDSETAFYDILKEHFNFENDVNLATISKHFYKLYDGSARLLFETIKLLEGKITDDKDEKKMELMLKTAQQIHLGRFDEISKSHLLVLCLLAYSPSPITKNNITDILESNEQIITEILNQLYNINFIDYIAHNITGQTLYCIMDEYLREMIKSGCSETEELFYKTKIYRAIHKAQIDTTLEQTMKLAIDLKEKDAIKYLTQYINISEDLVTAEKKAYYIQKLLNSITSVPEQLICIDIVQLLYTYGYYRCAEKIISAYIFGNNVLNFENLLLLGDIQHVLLSPETSQTYKQASEVQGISTSDKLKALNRQIMALNQEHQEVLARELYINTLQQYETSSCIGLVELYRNTNNSFFYTEAMEYTIKGFFLAKNLGEELEMYKCLHNICMLQLQYGHYGHLFESNPFNFEPTFELVLDFFAKHPMYRHEQAYPLLDLGTVKMFEFVDTHNQQCLVAAKKYYSEAQLYAKSFYARHIAETGLLVVNSYQYAKQQKSFVQGMRDSLYNRYLLQREDIEDYRVHRKILLSLALSAIISEDIQVATVYLGQANTYITGAETLRYNRLCQKAGCPMYKKEPVPLNGRYEVYYGSDEFVPWLISFCH